MTGSEVVQIVSLILTTAVSITTLLVRARIIGLEGEVKKLTETLTIANQMIIDQGLTITQLSQQLSMSTPDKSKTDKDGTWQGNPPYRSAK